MKKNIFIIIALIGFTYGCKKIVNPENIFIGNSIFLNSQQENNVGKLIKIKFTSYEVDNIETKFFDDINEDKQIKINIRYPQIIDMEDIELQKFINEAIEKAALDPYNNFLNNQNEFVEGTQWSIDYFIQYFNKDLISIKFEGYLLAKGNAHGTNPIYTVNIALKTGQILSIDELFDVSFNNKINPIVFSCIDMDTSDMDIEIAEEIFNHHKDAFNSSSDNFYFTPEKFVIILPIKDYYQFAAEYSDLYSCMLKDNSIWPYILDEL